MTAPEVRDPRLLEVRDYAASIYAHAFAMYLIPYVSILRTHMWKFLTGMCECKSSRTERPGGAV